MIYVHAQLKDQDAFRLVKMALIRSFTKAQVSNGEQYLSGEAVHVFLNPTGIYIDRLKRLSDNASKIIILGILPVEIADELGLTVSGLPETAVDWDKCEAAPLYGFSESKARICYEQLPEGLECFVADRPLLRFDFAKEWNNLGYGHVTTDGGMWSVACQAKPVSDASSHLAYIYQGEELLTIYAALGRLSTSKVLWINRSVGLIDTHELRLLDTFIANYVCDDLPCCPLLREIPFGYSAMISMRLDCDESIRSVRPLYELYESYGIPFSVAVKTDQPIDEVDVSVLRDIVESGGSILSHSVHHKPNWGLDYDDVVAQARQSRIDILSACQFIESLDYSVSPFHQNPDYAVRALNDSEYKGFIGGIICNDPQYLVSRAGKVLDGSDIVSHSQQCMLHGDCVLKSTHDPLGVVKQNAYISIRSGVAFGYLDHPFSERYQYGWKSEAERLHVHRLWLDYLKTYGDVLFVSEKDLLDFVVLLSNMSIWMEDGMLKYEIGAERPGKLAPAYEYKSKIYNIE